MSDSENVVTVTDADFDEVVLKADRAVLVDFWAEWCQPCLRLAPSLEALADELDGKLLVAKLNVEENQEASLKYGIRSLPTLIVFKNGEPIDMHVGDAPKSRIEAWVAPHL